MGKSKNMNCHDCQIEIELSGDDITNGQIVVYEENKKEIEVFKCNGCFEKDTTLSNYSPCEVYSRIVGYLRPIKEVNPGKAQEIKERKNYKI